MYRWTEPAVAPTEESRLEAQATKQLEQSPYREVRRVSCTARGNSVILTGRVRSFYYKQLAQSQLLGKLAASVSLDNRLEVVD